MVGQADRFSNIMNYMPQKHRFKGHFFDFVIQYSRHQQPKLYSSGQSATTNDIELIPGFIVNSNLVSISFNYEVQSVR